MRAITLEAQRLEGMLIMAVRDRRYPKENLPVLQAAALEVCELEYVIESDIRGVWWAGLIGGDRDA